jgi:PAS domain S-box-containing protein
MNGTIGKVILAISMVAPANALLALDPDKSIFQFNCQDWSRQIGLPADKINAVAQDQDGFIWLASPSGLIRFDGINFKVFAPKRAPGAGVAVNCISNAPDGQLWLSFSTGEFGSFDGKLSSSFGHPTRAENGKPLSAILAARDGSVWTGSTDGLERLMNGKPTDPDPNHGLSNISSLSEDSTRRVWIGTDGNGLAYWVDGRMRMFPDKELKRTSVLSVAVEPGGELWVATSKGIYHYDDRFVRKEILFATSRINTLEIDSHGVVWAGTGDMGLVRYEHGEIAMFGKKEGLADDSVTSLLEDAEGSLWIGTSDGLTQLSDVKFPIFSAHEGLPSGSSLALAASRKGGVWVASPSGAVYFDTRKPGGDRGGKLLEGRYLVRVFEARNGDLYLADNSRNGYVISGKGNVATFTNESWPQAFGEDNTSVLMVIGNKLMRIKDGKPQPFDFGTNSPGFGWLFSICVARDETIWLGSNRGIGRIRKGVYRDWANKDGLQTNRVDSVVEDSQGAIWASTTWGIVRVFDDKLTLITEADGLTDNRIFAVVPDDRGYLWVDSAKGIQRISRKSVDDFVAGKTKSISCQSFEGAESIKFVDRTDQAYSGCKTPDGRIWFPSPHGVIMVDPATYSRNGVPPKVSIEKVTVGGRDYTNPIGTSVRIHDQPVRFSFSVQGYIAPKKIRVRYQLKQADPDWIEAGANRSVTYEHLSPNNFIFRVQAANEDGVWNAVGDTFEIELLPPIYKSIWLYLLSGVLITLGTICFYGWKGRQARLRQLELENQNKLLESKIAQRTIQLDQSLSLIRATLDSTPDGVLAIQISDDAAIWNRQFVGMWEVPPEILNQKVGVSIVGHVAAQVCNAEPFDRWVRDSLAAPKAESIDKMVHKDGRAFEVCCRPQYLDGQRSGVVLYFRDVTDRNRIGDALRASEKRFKAMFDQAAVGVAQIELKTGRFFQINQHFCDMMGRSRDEMELLTIQEITSPYETGINIEKMNILRSGAARESTQEGRYLRKDGSTIWVTLTVSAMWQSDESPDYVIAVAQDVSSRKRLEDQIRQSQKMEAIGTLAGGIAHDFNNILSIIKGYSELAEFEMKGNIKACEHLGAVRMATSRATDLVRQILTFSRQQPHERRPIFLNSIVSETLKMLRATIPATIEFKQVLGADIPAVLADASQIHQILMNLGTNAWHAMKDRPGRLEVVLERFVVDAGFAATQPRLHPGNYARISISDTGCGIDQAIMGRIFEPFFTTKAPGEGTGLGLAVVHGIMEGHDGAITAHSSPGEGAVFRIYFPEYLGTTVVESTKEKQLPRGSGERLLLVDDEDLLAKMGRLALVELGYEVETATRPETALEMFMADPERFALVITDQTMPAMTGLVLSTRIKEIRPELPIILMTGNNLFITPEKLRDAGIFQVLLKPNSLITLGTAVQKALQSATSSIVQDEQSDKGRLASASARNGIQDSSILA